MREISQAAIDLAVTMPFTPTLCQMAIDENHGDIEIARKTLNTLSMNGSWLTVKVMEASFGITISPFKEAGPDARPWWDNQGVCKFWPNIGDRPWDNQPAAVAISRGVIVEFGSSSYMEPPEWEYVPMEAVIVRPIVRWFGRG